MTPAAAGPGKAGEPRSDELGPGHVIGGRYRIVRRVGAGAYGTVYEVVHTALGKHFALKLLNAKAREDSRTISRFEAEAVTASKIDHPNIVSITDIGRTDKGHAFYVMELLEGQTLARILRQGKLRVSRAVPILAATSHAVQAAHGAGVIHRDLKPDNIFVVPQEDAQSGRTREAVRILDFGLAKVSESKSFTVEGVTYGTPAYMSPEQVQGREIDGRSDIYSIGCIAYEMFAGRPVFRGSAVEVALAHCDHQPPPLIEAPSPRMRWLVDRCLKKDPAERFQSCADLLEELRGIAIELLTPDGTTKQLRVPSTAELERMVQEASSDEATLASAISDRANIVSLSKNVGWWDEFSDIAATEIDEIDEIDEIEPIDEATEVDPSPPSGLKAVVRCEMSEDDLQEVAMPRPFRQQSVPPAPPTAAELVVPRPPPPSIGGSEQPPEPAAESGEAGGYEEMTQSVDMLPPPARPRRTGLLLFVLGLLAGLAGGGFLFFRWLLQPPPTGGVMMVVEPAAAELVLNGKRRLESGRLRLIDGIDAPSTVRVSLSHVGCRPLTRDVRIEAGKVREIRLRLDCRPER